MVARVLWKPTRHLTVQPGVSNARQGIYLDNQKGSAQKKSVTLINVYATENDGGGITYRVTGAVTGTNTHSIPNNDAVGISVMIITLKAR
jgi:hypothetical protein